MSPWEPDESVHDALYDHFLWYVTHSEPFITSEDLGRARLVADAYVAHFPASAMEIIELCEPSEAAHHSDEFLGYDLTTGHASLLPWAIDPSRHDRQPPEDYAGIHLAPLLRIVAAHFSPMLNDHLLFDSEADADLCLRSLQALNQLYGEPWLFEHPDTVFSVLGVWLVYQPGHDPGIP